MIRLNSKNLLAASNAHLVSVQQDIDKEVTFEAKAKKAKLKWEGKTGSHAAQGAFSDIKNVLTDMCSGVQICVYCEHNEATDIEHIYPKRLYPDKAFTWNNYLFACGKCNTHYKAENFKIFSPAGSITVVDITPKPKVYVQPANDDALFINQRLEDPMTLLKLDIVNQQYLFREIHAAGTREYEKAKYTKDLLGLNDRADLVRQRQAAHKWYLSELKKYVAVKNAADFNVLTLVASGEVIVDTTAPFANEKKRVLNSIKHDLLSHSHPTVWRELIRQRNQLPQTNLLFNQAPEILNW